MKTIWKYCLLKKVIFWQDTMLFIFRQIKLRLSLRHKDLTEGEQEHLKFFLSDLSLWACFPARWNPSTKLTLLLDSLGLKNQRSRILNSMIQKQVLIKLLLLKVKLFDSLCLNETEIIDAILNKTCILNPMIFKPH